MLFSRVTVSYSVQCIMVVPYPGDVKGESLTGTIQAFMQYDSLMTNF